MRLSLPLMQLHGGWWAVVLPVAPGVHRVQVRVDGGAWGPPAGLPRVAEPGSGQVGMLHVEPDG